MASISDGYQCIAGFCFVPSRRISQLFPGNYAKQSCIQLPVDNIEPAASRRAAEAERIGGFSPASALVFPVSDRPKRTGRYE